MYNSTSNGSEPFSRPTTPGEKRSTASAVALSIFLVTIVVAACLNNVFGVLGLLAAPFWLPLCCYFVPLWLAKTYFGISATCLLLSMSLPLMGDYIALPKGFEFTIGLGSLTLTIGSLLGVLVSHFRQSKRN
jgi:hypothetical protein